ncbi:hypothetical protein BC833DRAFT_603144 [Globomyces pollinis-pini]|nr:hypothetical protein BC833DRAFT_603144 [Globomyces pollinis-pini]
MQSILSILTFIILTTIAAPQAPVALQATMPELASYKWVCRDHDQNKGFLGIGRTPYEDTVCRWVSSKDSNDFNGALDGKLNVILMVSALMLVHNCI